MSTLRQKLVHSYSVLYYYHLVDSNNGLKLEDIPEDMRNEVEIKANERLIESARELEIEDIITQ